MLRLFLTLAAAGFASAASIHAALAGCPSGAIGLGETQLCAGGRCSHHLRPPTYPDIQLYGAGGLDCPGVGLTSTIYAGGSCKPIATSTEIGNAGFCDDKYTKGASVGTCLSIAGVHTAHLLRPPSMF
jgi:hypothetical protein